MKQKKNILASTALPCVLTALTVMGTILYNACRFNWVFVNITVKVDSFTYILLYVMIANCIALGVLTALRVKNAVSKGVRVHETKAYRTALAVCSVLSVLLFVAAMVFTFSICTGESGEVYGLYLQKSLPTALALIGVPLCALLAGMGKSKTKTVITAVLLVVTFVFGFGSLVPLTPYRITSEPVVIDTGKDYSIVFSANGNGTGYVEYTYDGQNYKVYDENGGRLNTDTRIHSINVPYEHLNDNDYRVGSVRVIEQFSYGSHTGKEVVSEKRHFTPADEKDMTVLVISDWHTMLEKAYKAVSYVGDYDAIILLGDSSPGVDFEEQIVTNVVEFAGELSKGAMPVLYVRGNHETRGEYAGKLLGALGMDEFYYTAAWGEYYFAVLDSGEDKKDDHPEYGGLNDYETYRSDMIEWLRTQETDYEKVIVLSHAWQISGVEPELSEAGWNEIDRLGARLLLCGHQHRCRLLGTSEAEQAVLAAHPGIVGYIDGGKSGEDYIASVMYLSEDTIRLQAFNTAGTEVFTHEINWEE